MYATFYLAVGTKDQGQISPVCALPFLFMHLNHHNTNISHWKLYLKKKKSKNTILFKCLFIHKLVFSCVGICHLLITKCYTDSPKCSSFKGFFYLLS